MTAEENRRRSEDENVKYIKSRICDKDGDKAFIFISYKSDDWEIVLHDIVYRLVKEHGLNVYFDGSFESHHSLWISQFPENMEHYNCKGILAFFDDKYATSYATLLELMYSQTYVANEGLPVIPVNLSRLTKIGGPLGQEDTGLGVPHFDDGTRNINAEAEKELFDEAFEELTDREILKKAKYLYKGKKLTKRICSEIVAELIAYLKINDNFYEKGGSLEGIIGSLTDACDNDIFTGEDTATENLSSDEELSGEEQKTGEGQKRRKSGSLYTFTFEGEKYEEYKLKDVMLVVFERILPRHGDKIDELIEKLPCIGEGSLIGKDAKPAVFRAGKIISVEGRTISVGTSLDARAVFNYIDRLMSICGEPSGNFVIEERNDKGKNQWKAGSESAKEISSGGDAVSEPIVPKEERDSGKKKAAGDVYFFDLYGTRYENKKLKELMLTVFTKVMPKHEDKLDIMLELLPCLGEGRLIKKDARPTVFRAGEAVTIGGRTVSIGTSLGRGAVLSYIGKLMHICGEPKERLTIDHYEY